MATEIELNTKINTANSAQSLGDLNKSLKELRALTGSVSEGTKDFDRLNKAILSTESKLGDLKTSFGTLRGTGIERLNSSLGLLREGLSAADPTKIGIAFKGLGAAMKAVPIFLLVEGITYLVQNFDELSKGSGILAQALRFVGDIIDDVKDGFYAVTDAIGVTNSELDKSGEAIKGYAETSKEALTNQNAEFDRQIRVAKAAGKSTVELEIAKQKAIIDTNVAIARQIEAFVRAGGELDDEKKKLLTASLNAIKDAKVTELEVEVNHTKKINDEYKKRLDDKKKHEAAVAAETKKSFDEEIQRRFQIVKEEREEAEKKAAEDAATQKQADELFAQLSAEQDKIEEETSKKKQDDKKKIADEEKAIADASISNAQNLASLTQNISDIAFNAKMAKVKKGSAEEEALMKKQFEINKKVQIAQVTISAATSAIEAYKSLAGIPIVGPVLGGIAAGVAVTAGFKTVQKIRATKFEGGGSSGGDVQTGGSGSVSSGAGQGASLPNQRIQPTNFRRETVGQIGSPGGANTPSNQQGTTAEVSVVEISRVTNKVRATESMSKF